MNRVAEVNRALRLIGRPERLTRGRGYYYFHGGAAETWYSASVMTFRADALTVDEWIAEFHRLESGYIRQ